MIKAYQCSQCAHLKDCGETVTCSADIDPRQNQRQNGDAELCKKKFEPLDKDKQWHEKFAWEG